MLLHLLLFASSFLFLSSLARDAEFDVTLALPPLKQEPVHIPKVAHFVFSNVKNLTWQNYAAVKAAQVVLKVDKINLWVPRNDTLPGEIWQRTLHIPGAVVRETDIPDSVYGKELKVLAHVSDIIRMKALYEEGGIYLDYNLIALRSSDPVVFNTSTEATVLAREGKFRLCNALIMSKPRAPFLKKWMEQYVNFDDSDWLGLSVRRPWEMARDGAKNLTVLDPHAWFYPLIEPHDYGLMTMWLGKSWWDVDQNYGVHFWPWLTSPQRLEFDPHTIRLIDTPLFCSIRHLFDNLDGDGYYSIPADQDPNCSIPWMRKLHKKPHGLFADYQAGSLEDSEKWIDNSGNHLHGWALNGTSLHYDPAENSIVRNFTQGSNAVLALPVDWDARVGSISLKFKLDLAEWHKSKQMGLFSIRFGDWGHIRFSLYNNGHDARPMARVEWIRDTHGDRKQKVIVEDTSQLGPEIHLLPLLNSSYDVLTVAWDRTNEGSIQFALNGNLTSSIKMPLMNETIYAKELWVNSENWTVMDTGFRGSVAGLKLYSHQLSDEDLVSESSLSAFSSFRSSSGYQFRIFHPTLSDYITLTRRMVTPIYPADAAAITSLLDIHISAPSLDEDSSKAPLQIFEAGTGHGSLTLHLAKAIHAANRRPPPIPDPRRRPKKAEGVEEPESVSGATPSGSEESNCAEEAAFEEERTQRFEEWKRSRRAIIHTLDINQGYSDHARNIIHGFRHGLYYPHIDFHCGELELWINKELEAHSSQPFLAHAILDLPSADQYLSTVAKAVQTDGIVMLFCPNISQIITALRRVKGEGVALYLDKVMELGTGSSTGGREWSVGLVKPRATIKADAAMKAEIKAANSLGSASTGARNATGAETSLGSSPRQDGAAVDEGIGLDSTVEGDQTDPLTKDSPTTESMGDPFSKTAGWEVQCRPKVGVRVTGGGFLGIFRKTRRSND
ncbi:MAG: hypothetical protein M4579_004222 [Chaenotheca gracillima]|nr:MAG: hypothetical protein M4579_004222 [Chaenotheca gracillima]